MNFSLLSAPRRALAPVILGALLAFAAPLHAQTFGPGPGGAIPDNNSTNTSPTPFVSTITVPTSFTLVSLNSVTITGFTHTWMGDLTATLTHGSTTVDLFYKVGATSLTGVGDSSDLGGNYTFAPGGANFITAATTAGGSDVIAPGTYAPSTASFSPNSAVTFANFSGLNANGAWTLTLTDRFGGDTGAVTGWSFNVTPPANGPAPVPEPGTLAAFALGAGSLGLLAVKRRRMTTTA